MEYEQLKLSNQLCFPLYAASRLVTKEYQPHLEKLGITYPQYLVLMVLWETNELTVNEIGQKLLLNTNTITPLLKRMEIMGILERKRSSDDERKVIITLTKKGVGMQHDASKIPEALAKGLMSEDISLEELITLRDKLNGIIEFLTKKEVEIKMETK